MINESSIVQFSQVTRRPFRWERWYGPEGKMWQASCQFDVKIEINPALDDLEKMNIEYRQFVRGGVWVRRGNEDWAPDNAPNGNEHFEIPAWDGQTRVTEMPRKAVREIGLTLAWKEDGQIEGNSAERFGYRDTANVNATNEVDLWHNPTQITGRSYHLRDTPSIRGRWGSGDSVEVWIELYFRGFVVEVERDPETNASTPVRVLKQKNWSYFWHPEKLSLWSDAVQIA